jgi:hypothetical protein
MRKTKRVGCLGVAIKRESFIVMRHEVTPRTATRCERWMYARWVAKPDLGGMKTNSPTYDLEEADRFATAQQAVDGMHGHDYGWEPVRVKSFRTFTLDKPVRKPERTPYP